MTHDLAALLQAVLDDPDDLASRRVYGDALIGAGDPRGELINTQCDLSVLPSSDPRWPGLLQRETELLAKHTKAWTAPFPFVFNPKFERGFIERVYVNTKKFVPAAAELFSREPITTLQMRELTQASATTLGALPSLARLRALRVTESKLGVKALQALISARLTNLRSLGLYQAGIDDEGLAHLGDTVFPQLERLDLSGTRVTYNGLEKLLRDPRLAKLGYLGAKWLFPATDGTGFLAEHLDLPALTHLDLGSSHVDNADLRHLAANSTFQKLRGLRLEHNELDGAGAIAGLGPLSKLEVLDLSTNAFDVAAATELATWKQPLRVLRLSMRHRRRSPGRAREGRLPAEAPRSRVRRAQRARHRSDRQHPLAPREARAVGDQDRRRRCASPGQRELHRHAARAIARLQQSHRRR
ncbi:MAG: TIGR02996 domain-containing protein, partial [Deltaproteobacteria bacterium]|nr:TIGR02996 domain-containing protein [Deltaproteobacteria bacterium]